MRLNSEELCRRQSNVSAQFYNFLPNSVVMAWLSSFSSPTPTHFLEAMCLKTYRRCACPHIDIITYPCHLLTPLFARYPKACVEDCCSFKRDGETIDLMCLDCEKENDHDMYRPILPIRPVKKLSWPKRVESVEMVLCKETCGKEMYRPAIESLLGASERFALEELWI